MATSLNNLAVLSAAQGRWAEAAESIDRERRVVRRHVARVLPALAEAEQLAFLKANDESQLHMALSLALARRDDPDAVGRSAGWVLNGKAVAQEALAQRACWPATATTPPPPGSRDRAATTGRPDPGQPQARPGGGTPPGDRPAHRARARAVQASGPEPRPARPRRPWVAPEEVRRALPADAVLVEIARFDVFNFQAKGTEKHGARRTMPRGSSRPRAGARSG